MHQYTNCLSGETMEHFIIEVPPEAKTATNFLASTTGGPLDLFYSSLGVPSGDEPTDVLLMGGVVDRTFRVVDTIPPPLLPRGQRYYLTVRNYDPSQTNCFSLRVDLGVPIVVLTNAIPYASTNANDGLQDFYAFDVSQEAMTVRFAMTNMSGNLNLRARKAPRLPTRSGYDYISKRPGRQLEAIDIRIDSAPVRLSPGRWYLSAVLKRGGLPTTNEFDAFSRNAGTDPDYFIVTRTSAPVTLTKGKWFLGVYPVDTPPVTYQVQISVERDLSAEPVLIGVTIEDARSC